MTAMQRRLIAQAEKYGYAGEEQNKKRARGN